MKFILMLITFGAVNVWAVSTDGEALFENLEDSLKLTLHLDPDTVGSISELVDQYNYTLEAHEVITEDGYILTLHRISRPKPDSIKGPRDTPENNITRPVVLLVHGLLCSSADWLFQGPNASLAFQLVDQGYDVWLTNSRGNSYSNKHVVFTIKDPQFWNFSIHEIGYYDMASNIDYIQNVTRVDKITYIGHSQGTTEGSILLSSRPEYNEKLNLMVMLSPVIYVAHLKSPLFRLVVINNEVIKQILDFFGIYAMQHGRYVDILCRSESQVLDGLCIFLMELFAGFDVEQIDKSKLEAFFTFTPSGASYKDIDHLAQVVASGKFRQFDYGDPTKNYQHYGSDVPPSYDISRISVPVALYYSKNDYFVAVEDAERFISELETKIADQYLIEFDKFSHLDFIMAKDVKTLLYDRVVGMIQKYNPLPRS